MPIHLAIHGGAGALDRPSADDHRAARAALADALRAGQRELARGAPAIDAVVAAVAAMEASGCFNAGRGAVRDTAGGITLDAALMEGTGRRAGAVAGVRRVRQPVLLARAVLERTPHVLLAGEGAEAFADAQGIARVDDSWFTPVDGDREPRSGCGTVGAVARDAAGGYAAATSTGGTTAKLPGRVGDTPLIGAGTYADARCAVSATGVGEYFIRTVFAHRIAVAIAAGATVSAASTEALAEVRALGGSGGCIAIAGDGVALPFTTQGMYRGWMDDAGRFMVGVGHGPAEAHPG